MFFLVGGVGLGLASESGYLRACVLLLVALLFWLANSRCAFVLFMLFGVAAAYPLSRWIHMSHFDYYLKNGWLVLTSATLIIAPVLIVYACWARRYAKTVNPETVADLTHIVAIDDEVFLVLGLALAVQRSIQFAMWAIIRPFTIGVLFAGGCIALALTAVLGLFLPSVNRFIETNSLYLAIPFAALLYAGALLIFVKVILFGIAYGWDMAGLSMDHEIYVSPGSFVQKTDLYIIEPEQLWQWQVSHTEIHQRPSTLDVITELLERAFERMTTL